MYSTLRTIIYHAGPMWINKWMHFFPIVQFRAERESQIKVIQPIYMLKGGIKRPGPASHSLHHVCLKKKKEKKKAWVKCAIRMLASILAAFFLQ